MFLHITEVKYLHDYQVEVTFNNGRKGIADLSSALRGPVFEPLKNPIEFSKIMIEKETETVAWPNGADLAPEFVYFQVFKSDPDLEPLFRKWGYFSKTG
jgi:hypothetical protein